MGKMVENPRYHVLCFRVSDEHIEALDEIRCGKSRSEILLEALKEKLAREADAAYRERVEAELRRVA